MKEEELIDYLESCNMTSRKPTKNFIELKEEHDTIVLPRRRIISELNIIDRRRRGRLKDTIIKVEKAFEEKVLWKGELQVYFYTHELEDIGIADLIHMAYFKYSADITKMPEAIYYEFENNSYSSRNNEFVLMQEKLKKFKFFLQNYYIMRYGEEYYINGSNTTIKICKISSVIIFYFTINNWIYFDYEEEE